MNALRNKVSLIGRLGAQPEVVTFDSGKTLARFSIATNENYKNKEGEWQENTQWHNIVAWGKTAELIGKMLNKGQEVVVEGRLVHKTYKTKDGEKRYGTEIEVNEFLMLSAKTENEK
ncbi:MAG: single-stranded DNA-binding protein [Crocinitomicaceae bacterium]|nr:single-stranded DNA-binding protein [Crocinitomicaceae bacterium]